MATKNWEFLILGENITHDKKYFLFVGIWNMKDDM